MGTDDDAGAARRIVDAVRADAHAALQAGRTALQVLTLASAAVGVVESAGHGSPQRAQRACRAGCSACCHLMVSITPPEAFLIVDRLRATRSPAALASLRERMAATAAQVEHLTIEQRARARVPCALLAGDGSCSIHEFRPLGCRGWTSFSKDDCDAALREARPGHDGPQDRALYTAAAAASEALGTALRAERLDAGNYEFHGALCRAIELPDAVERWVRGEEVFGGCGRVRSELLKGA